jgi:hypothetical protein
MNAMSRASMTLLAAGATGCLLWIASQFNGNTTRGYWAAMGVIAAGGLLLGLAQLRGGGGNPPGMFLLSFLPVAVLGLWIIITAEPYSNTFRNHLRAWDADLGIGGVVHDISRWNGVVALGIGLVCGLTLEPFRRRVVVPAVTPAATVTPASMDTRAADEPLTAEREAAADRESTTTNTSTTRTVRS